MSQRSGLNLSVRFGDVVLKNPIAIASGPLTDKFTKIAAAAEAGAGAVSLKLTFVSVPFQSQMRTFSLPGNVIMSPTNKRLGIQQAEELMRRIKGELDVPMFANYSAVGGARDEWELMTERFLDAGTDLLEPNFCCPNLDTSDPRSKEAEDHGGASIADHPDVCAGLVATMRKMTDRPIVPKIMPSTRGALLKGCEAMRQAGADGVHVVGTPASGLPPLLDDGTPDMPLLEGIPQGSTNGSVCRYATYLSVAQVAQTVDIPVIGSGGLDTWHDVVDAIMWGATGVGICSAIMWNGWEVVGRMLTGIEDYLERRGLSSLDEIRGLALSNFTTPDKVALVDGHAVVDEEICIGCGRCLKPGHCEAIAMTDDDKARVDPDECIGCGVCRSLCPVGAISYKVKEKPEVAEVPAR
ncbi:MAG: 4Fe-4S binding protein [Phycisphaerae bacterium]|nr:4Fe-4S binding protein [Phycisphaerae bacterium]